MSGKAFGWARDVRCSGGLTAKAVLLLMADYADREHLLSPSVATMAEELQAHDRTVQRALGSLEEDGLIEREFRTTAHGKATSNRYRLCVDEPRQSATPSPGAAPPLAPAERHRHPGTAPPSTTFEPLQGRESADALSERAREADEVGEAFERVEKAWGLAAPTAVARPRDWREWQKAAVSVDPAALDAAAGRYLAHCASSGDRVFSLQRWLADAKFEPWLTVADATATPVAATFDGPADFANSVRAEKLAHCGWDEAERAVVVTTNFMADRLRQDLRQQLALFNIKIIVRKAA